MRVVVAGAGRVGVRLAQSLADDGHDVTVIDNDPRPLEELGKGFNGTTVEGQAFDVVTLRDAGLDETDAFVAVTNSDNANLMAVQVAKKVFEVPRTIARLYDAARETSYEALGIRYITGTRLIADVIFEDLIDVAFDHHLSFSGGDVEIVEFEIASSGTGMAVKDLEIDDRLRIAAIRRGEETYVPDGDFLLQTGDLVVAAARDGVHRRVAPYLSGEETDL